MKNLMDTYLDYTEKTIKKYLKTIFSKYYDDEIVIEYLKTYINARYYNITNTAKPARAFYLRILDELEYKEDILMEKCEGESESLDEKQAKLNMIHKVKEVFDYILFFDNVRKVENFKTIDNIKEIIDKMLEVVNESYEIKGLEKVSEKLYQDIKNDMLEKDIFLDKFATDEFELKFENTDFSDELFYVELSHNVKMPMQYSELAIEKVFQEGIVAEDKLQIEYILLSAVAIRDIIEGNFKDTYITEFECSLFKKKQKLNGLLELIGNQALQEKISLNITYSDYIKNQKGVLEYTKKGFEFVITLDDSLKHPEDIEKLGMFKLIIVHKDITFYKEIKQNKYLKNVIFK